MGWSGLQGHELEGEKGLCKGRLRCRYHSCRPQEALCFELRRRCSKASAMIWLASAGNHVVQAAGSELGTMDVFFTTFEQDQESNWCESSQERENCTLLVACSCCSG